ncbi:hypothetical protein, partial [Pseudorhodoferax aquiterrae]|uniref:hypothetical protein n=1 Tax=Pseudorhodoferax aquiterrae TaxID=747304 RepID=UPI001E460125
HPLLLSRFQDDFAGRLLCDVHLVETSRHTSLELLGASCCYCGAVITGEGTVIEGHLDDGSPGLHRFVYHDDCAWDMEHDLDEIDEHDGCFSYGTAVEVVFPAAGVTTT